MPLLKMVFLVYFGYNMLHFSLRTKELYVQLYKVSKGMNQLFTNVYWVRWTKCEKANQKLFIFSNILGVEKIKLFSLTTLEGG